MARGAVLLEEPQCRFALLASQAIGPLVARCHQQPAAIGVSDVDGDLDRDDRPATGIREDPGEVGDPLCSPVVAFSMAGRRHAAAPLQDWVDSLGLILQPKRSPHLAVAVVPEQHSQLDPFGQTVEFRVGQCGQLAVALVSLAREHAHEFARANSAGPDPRAQSFVADVVHGRNVVGQVHLAGRRRAAVTLDTMALEDRVDVAHKVEHLTLLHGRVEHGGRVLESQGVVVLSRLAPAFVAADAQFALAWDQVHP